VRLHPVSLAISFCFRVGDPRFPGTVTEIHHLLNEVFVGKAGDVRVLRPTFAVGIVAQAAGVDPVAGRLPCPWRQSPALPDGPRGTSQLDHSDWRSARR
jgi:hypothetical protein